jgi:hypothetical protein
MNSETDKLIKQFGKLGDNNFQKEGRRELSASNFNAEMRALTLEMHAEYSALRKSWSKHILFAFWGLLGFEVLFIIGVGLKIISFEEYSALPQIVVGTFAAHIIGLVVIVAKFLFPNNSK